MKKKFTAENPRFVLNLGSIKECFPDLPDQGDDITLWDRQEQKPVITIHAAYA